MGVIGKEGAQAVNDSFETQAGLVRQRGSAQPLNHSLPTPPSGFAMHTLTHSRPRPPDFAIGQFRFLRRLMFVHGRNVYRRLPTLIYYIFYKNIIETLVQYWFTTQAGWSGETPFVQIVINWCARA